jgi:DNA-directed RNA polymerase subunit RPC12/RpoP
MTEYICTLCNKKYASNSSLCHHQRKYHNKRRIIESKDEPSCQYCNKIFSTSSNRNKHVKICKLAPSTDKINISKETYDSISKMFMLMIENQKEQKAIPIILSESIGINNNGNITNGNINNTQNTQNIQNNFNINIVPLGNENLSEVLSAKEQLKILKQKYESLEYLIKYIHFNNKYPQFQNIAISNLKDNIAYKYDSNNQDFIAVSKEELLNDLIENRMNDIYDFVNNNDVPKQLGNKVEKLANNLESENYLTTKKQKLKMLIYNGTNEVSGKRKLVLKK